jgi:hypothetical protein
MHFSYAIIAAAFLFVAQEDYAQTTISNEKSAAAIFSNVTKASKTINCFSAEIYQLRPGISNTTSQNSKCYYYQTNYPDGRNAFRSEIVSTNIYGSTNKTITIKNSDGIWLLTKGKAIKMEFAGDLLSSFDQFATALPMPDKNSISDTVQETNFLGNPCYLITESLDTTLADSAIMLLQNDLLRNLPHDSNVPVDTLFPVTRQYYIGTNNFFLYSVQSINKYNKKTSEITFKNIVINPHLQPDTFSIPEGTTIIVARSLDEYVNAITFLYSGTPLNQGDTKHVNKFVRYSVLTISVLSALFILWYLLRDAAPRKRVIN